MSRNLFNLVNKIKSTVNKTSDNKSLTDFLSNNKTFIDLSIKFHTLEKNLKNKINDLKNNLNNK